jgi:predicted nicotinamide N-methyase
MAVADPIEETVAVGGRALSILRPRDSEALIDEEAFDRDEFMPFWAELWPSAVALARVVGARQWRGARVVELGCGLGVPSIAAALGGARVTATDWSAEAVDATRENAERNGARVEALVCDWARPDAIVDRAPWDVVLGADLVYESRNAVLLLELLPRLVDASGEVWLADPGRPPAEEFWVQVDECFSRDSGPPEGTAGVTIHRLSPRAPVNLS